MQKYHVFNEEFDQTDLKKWNLEMHFERGVQIRFSYKFLYQFEIFSLVLIFQYYGFMDT